MFDIEQCKYVKFDGGPASLQAEITEIKAKKKEGIKREGSLGSLD